MSLTSGSEQTIGNIKYKVLSVYQTEDFDNNKVNTVSAQQNNFTGADLVIPAEVTFDVKGTSTDSKAIDGSFTFKVVQIANSGAEVGFKANTNIKTVTIGSNGKTYVQTIDANAFQGSTNIESVTFLPYTKYQKNAGTQTFGAGIFVGDTKITTLNLAPTTLATIENYFGTTYAYAAIPADLYTKDEAKAANATNGDVTYNYDHKVTAGEVDAINAVLGAGVVKTDDVLTDAQVETLNGAVPTFIKTGDTETPAVDAVAAVGNTTLQSITLPATWKTLAKGAFENCSKLATVNFTAPVAKLGEQTVNAKAFLGCPIATLDMTNTNIATIPSTMLVDGDKVVYNAKTTSVIMPATLTTIGASAFNGCVGLETVDFSKANLLTSIGNYAFGTTPSLTKIDLSGATSLEAFTTTPFIPALGEKNTELTWIILPTAGKVNDIDKSFKTPGTALANLPVLSKLEGLAKVTTIVDGAFANDAALTSLSFPNTLTSIEGSPFQGCTSLSELTFNGNALATFGNDATALYGTTTNVLTSLTITNDVKAAFAAGILTNQAGLATVSIASGKEIKNTATLNAGAITVAEGASITLGKISKDPTADGFIVVGDGTKAATVNAGVINAALTKELVTGKIAMTIAGIENVAVALDALGKTATSLTITGEIKHVLTKYTAANAELTTINLDNDGVGIKMVASTFPTNMNNGNQATALTINWHPADANAVAAFAVNAFANASVGAANAKVTLNTTTKVADLPAYGRSEANFYNVKLVAALASVDIALENNGTGSFYYAKFYGAGDYKIAKATAEGKKVIVYGAYVDNSDKEVYMEQLHVINGYYYVPANVPVIVKSEANATKAESAAGEGLSSMNLAQGGANYVSTIAYLEAETVGTSLMNLGTDYDWSVVAGKTASIDNKGYDLYAFAKFSKYNILPKKFGPATTLPEGTFYIRKIKAAGAPEALDVIWLDGSEPDVTGIETLKAADQQFNGDIYTIQGVRVSAPQKGQIYIQNGKKFMMK